MSVKHNISHKVRFGRGRSNYPLRLRKRGLAKAPALAEIEGPTGLRARQERRVKETGVPWRVWDSEPELADAA